MLAIFTEPCKSIENIAFPVQSSEGTESIHLGWKK
jgi:hypothetical protein